jgi:D-alanyl-lipoteichoic acid acyltransferase DltB (MBOAT superfamily)
MTHDELVPQFADETKKNFDWENFSKGCYAFTLGMVKKVLVADTLAHPVTWGYAHVESLDSLTAFMLMLFYTLQIYFDFSGYCDMATGIGHMFNIKITQNFNSPYKALDILDFWKRWHMTLTRFLTRYIYIPLGGNRKGKVRTYVNVMVVFFVSGLWHGANWTFILWGMLHGLFSVITRAFQGFFAKIPKAVGWLITFAFLNITWIYFRADTIAQGNEVIGKLFSFKITDGFQSEMVALGDVTEFRLMLHLIRFVIPAIETVLTPLLLLSIVAFACVLAVTLLKNTNEKLNTYKPKTSISVTNALLLAWCVVSFSGITTFIYWNF